MATAPLGHADPLLRDHDVAWRPIDIIGSGSRRTATGQPRLLFLRLTHMVSRRTATGGQPPTFF
jgi:hypothetical protein